MNIAVFVSGNGSNLQALIDAQAEGGLGGGKIKLVVCDKNRAIALKRAEKAAIRTFVPDFAVFDSRENFETAIMKELSKEGIELVVLAGFMRLLSGAFIRQYENRILNIHPSLLPSFKGVYGIRDAFDYGVKITGVTVHFVNEELDAGPIIIQKEVKLRQDDTFQSLEKKIHAVEHKIYPEAVKLFVEGKLVLEGNKVKITEKKR
jgi:phosphoribosylglycinamide formyltransferase-1